MNSRIKTLAVTAAAVLLLGSQATLASVVVKQVDKDGRITYTDRPDPHHVVLAQYRESGPAGTVIDQPPVVVDEPVAAPLSDVERALRSFTRLATPLALSVDNSEAARRLREQAQAARNSALPRLVFTRAEPDTRTGTGTPPGLAARIFSPLFYLLVSLGVGFMAYLAARIFTNGILPRCQELCPGISAAMHNGMNELSVLFDRCRHALPFVMPGQSRA